MTRSGETRLSRRIRPLQIVLKKRRRASKVQMQAEPNDTPGNHRAADNPKRFGCRQAISGSIEDRVVQ